ncbi:MAG: hypothetical protein R3338_04545 [Thermoanaerobaculia bacterium]|nr:hypothetical protein [Thermoanaerobaculia bacterium]
MRLIESGRLVVPVDADVAIAFAKKNLVSVHSRLRRLLAIFGVVRIGGNVRDRVDTSPFFFIDDLRERERVTEIVSDLIRDREEWLVLESHRSTRRDLTTVFFFSDGALQNVVRIRRITEGEISLSAEAELLRRTREQLSLPLKTAVPRVGGDSQTRLHEILILSSVPGQPLGISMQRSIRQLRAHRRHLVDAGRWLGRFHRETSVSSGDEVVVHGDFWPRTILFGDSAEVTGVVDWEHGSLRGERWRDLFTLPLLFAIDRPGWRSADRLERFEEAFIRDSEAASILRSYFGAYGTESGVTVESLEPMFERFLASSWERGKEESGWSSRMPWPEMRDLFAKADHSVFSG